MKFDFTKELRGPPEKSCAANSRTGAPTFKRNKSKLQTESPWHESTEGNSQLDGLQAKPCASGISQRQSSAGLAGARAMCTRSSKPGWRHIRARLRCCSRHPTPTSPKTRSHAGGGCIKVAVVSLPDRRPHNKNFCGGFGIFFFLAKMLHARGAEL